jgi:hypothetical protein
MKSSALMSKVDSSPAVLETCNRSQKPENNRKLARRFLFCKRPLHFARMPSIRTGFWLMPTVS